MSFTPLERHQLKEMGFPREMIEDALSKIRRMAPRCETCRWWRRLTADDLDAWGSKEGDGHCRRVDELRPVDEPPSLAAIATSAWDGHPSTAAEGEARLDTAPEFGCIQWEPQERRGG